MTQQTEAWGYLDSRPDHPERLSLFTADGKMQCTFAAGETEASIADRLAPHYRVRDRLVFKL